MLQKSTLPMFSVNLNLISQYTRKNLICSLTLKKEEGFSTKVPYFLNFKWEAEVYLYFLFSLTLHSTFYLFQPFCKFCQYASTPHQMKDYLRSYCFSSLDLRQNRNLKNIALIWVTLEKNSKFDTLNSFTHF